VLAVAGGKGGSGKTTTTVGLARALARRGASVVAADADWDLPNLAAMASETADSFAEPRRLSGRSMKATDAPEQAPALPDPGDRTILDVTAERNGARFKRSMPTYLDAPDPGSGVEPKHTFDTLDALVSSSSALLVDCPAGVSPDAAAPLRVADRCVLVTPLRQAALYDAVKTAAFARRLDCPPVGAIVVRTESIPGAVETLLECPVLGHVPARPPAPLSARSVQSAYDIIARRLCDTYGDDQWRVA
jgi:septum site-determining protein MinD